MDLGLNGYGRTAAFWYAGANQAWERMTYPILQAGEKRAHEDNGELLGSKDGTVTNPYVPELLEDMATWDQAMISKDGFLLYL